MQANQLLHKVESVLFHYLQLVTISEYHLKQINDNMPSFCSDTEGSFTSSEGGHNFSIGMIYQSKVIISNNSQHNIFIKGKDHENILRTSSPLTVYLIFKCFL